MSLRAVLAEYDMSTEFRGGLGRPLRVRAMPRSMSKGGIGQFLLQYHHLFSAWF
jgi:hypothetical protein